MESSKSTSSPVGPPGHAAPSGTQGPLGGYWRVVVLGVLVVGALALRTAHGPGGLADARAGVLLAFMGFGPGLAIMGILRLDDLLLELSLALALSLVLETILAMGMLVLKRWTPPTGLTVLIVLTVIGAVVQVNQVHKLKSRNRLPHAATA